jgi:hypothetical protein
MFALFGLPEGIPIKMPMDADGTPDPLVYELVGRQDQSTLMPDAAARCSGLPNCISGFVFS